jgi:hypothetical protein
MKTAVLMVWVLLMTFTTGFSVGAQTPEISPEDLEVIEALELLENLDILGEDLEPIISGGLPGDADGR